MKNTKNNKVDTVLAISAGIAALSAAGYFFFGPNGAKNRKGMKGWMIKMKGEVVEKLESAKEVSEPVYNSIVDTVTAKYAKVVDKAELESLTKELKKHWKMISQVGVKSKKVVKKEVAKKLALPVKKTVTKVVAKSPRGAKK